MNVGKKVHLALALAGLGTFLLAAPAYAQQETDPDHFTMNGVEAFQESTKALPARPAKATRAHLSRQSANVQLAAAHRRGFTRAGSKLRTRRAASLKQTAAERRMAALPRRW